MSILDLVTRESVRVGGRRQARAARWSPDGEWIVFVDDATHELWRVRPDDTDLQRISDQQVFWGVAWSPDSQSILAADRFTEHWHLFDVETGQATRLSWRRFRAAPPSWVRP